jgi:hypothetical protein
MKKLIFTVLATVLLTNPVRVLAEDTGVIVCPQPYGGAVVCGVHTPVNTGIGDNLAVAGAVLLASSLVFLIISKKFNTSQA